MHADLVKDIRYYLANANGSLSPWMSSPQWVDEACELLARVLGNQGIALVALEDVTAESLVEVTRTHTRSYALRYDFRGWFPEEVFYDNHDVVRFLKSAGTLSDRQRASIEFDAEACHFFAYGPRASLVAAAQALIDHRENCK